MKLRCQIMKYQKMNFLLLKLFLLALFSWQKMGLFWGFLAPEYCPGCLVFGIYLISVIGPLVVPLGPFLWWPVDIRKYRFLTIFAKKRSRFGTLRASEAQTAGLIEKWQK